MEVFQAKYVFMKRVLMPLMAVASLSILSIPSEVLAETLDEQQARLQQEVTLLELEQKIEEAREAIAEARQNRAAAIFPDIDPSDAPDGSIKIEKLEFESTLLAYRALDAIASEVQADITNEFGSEIVLIIADSNNVSSAAVDRLFEQSFSERVVDIRENYKAFDILPTESPFISTAASFLLDALPFFRVDREFQGISVTLEDQAFVSQLSAAFREAGQLNARIYYPSEYPLISNDSIDSILEDIGTLQSLQQQAKEKISSFPDAQQAALAAVNQSVDDLFSELADDSSDKKLLENILRARTLQDLVNSGIPIYHLSFDIVGGGTNRTSRSFLSNRLRHSGGAIVNYRLYDANLASIVLSNIHDSYTGFTKIPDSE